MPDAAKLVAAALIGLLAFIVSFQIIPLFPESVAFGNFAFYNAVLGVVTGWVVMGKRAGRGVTAAVNNGLGGAMMLTLWGLFIYSCAQMFDRAMDNWYNGAFTALGAIFEFMAEYALVIMDTKVITSLVVGGIFAGLLTEFAWRTWR
ncbi:TrgA family protein [Roseobacter sp.]|uniref:TrgA family protein n=1 Tax=Roseobacter sp. TaxID=1907202 RepID=UPI0025E9F843|nr:TrgA family protein [Roseobacter sp.]